MNSIILRTATRLLISLLLLYSIFLLLRGHDLPGGGFIGGLVAAGALALYMITFGVKAMRSVLYADPQKLFAIGLVLAVASGLVAAFIGSPFLEAQWVKLYFAGREDPLKLGTPLLFDIGVYFVVIGFALTTLIALEEEA